MSGRGRGFRGGRGRGFAGRGAAPLGPVARDDDGNVVAPDAGKPPSDYPVIAIPENEEPQDDIKTRVATMRRLLQSYKESPYYIEIKQQVKGSIDEGLERYSVRRAAAAKPREPLSTVLTLTPNYFPAELYNVREAAAGGGAGRGRSEAAYWQRQGARGGDAGSRLTQLERLEEAARAGKLRSGDDDDGGAARRDDMDGMEDVADQEDYDADDENGDYEANLQDFDDDEEYGDDDGGENEGAYY